MTKKLQDKTKQWMGLERATFEQRAVAEQYYETELMQLIVKEFIRSNKSRLYEKAEYMILSVGTSYEPLVLNISLFQPSKILFLYTEKTEVTIDKIVDFCALPSSSYQKVLVQLENLETGVGDQCRKEFTGVWGHRWEDRASTRTKPTS